jgi:hypothetical protein
MPPPLSDRVLYDKDMIMKSTIRTAEYGKMMYNPYQNLYYRFFFQSQHEQNELVDYPVNIVILQHDYITSFPC